MTLDSGRRNLFLGSLGVLTTSALPRWSSAQDDARRVIPSTGARIPAIGLGSWITFNVGTDPVLLDKCAAVVAAFVAEGGGMIDSSPMYGSSQATIGYALQRLVDATEVFAADKVWTGSVDEGPEQIAASRRKWDVDAFDLLQVHNLVEWRGHLATLFAMKAEGRLGHVGITTSHGRRHGLTEQVMRDHPIDFVQLTYNLADREAAPRLLPLAREKGIAVIANRPFRRGALPRMLAGKPLPGFAAEIGAESWPQLLLKFIISHPAITVAIPATTRVDHVRENKGAARGPMPDEETRRRIAAYFDGL